MAIRAWQQLKICYCHHIDQEVALEAEVVYPPEWLPDIESARVLGHRCSHGMLCNLDGRVSCLWAGTNPSIDPFLEKMSPISNNTIQE